MVTLKVLTHMETFSIMISIQEIFSWDMNQRLQPIEPLFKILWLLKIDTSFSASLLAILILHLYSNGDLIVGHYMMVIQDFPSYSQAPSNISMLMGIKMAKI
jgi:hypothetical protein